MKNMDVAQREPVWMAVSTLYLDTEVQWYTYRAIAKVIKESPYTLDEIKVINKTEVFPVLVTNLISVAGVWSGFDEAWLTEEITKSLNNRNRLKKLWSTLTFKMFSKMFDEHWEAVERYIKEE